VNTIQPHVSDMRQYPVECIHVSLEELLMLIIFQEFDRSLLEWFATLTPEQRLAELESRISFLLSLRPQFSASASSG